MSERSISFMGLGYVGLTTAVCFASKGFKVVGFDVDEQRVEEINDGVSPFYEPGLEELLKNVLRSGLFRATSDYRDAVLNTGATFITVGTPSRDDGSIDLSYVESAARMIGEALREKSDWHLAVVKSTVTPLTTECVVKPIIEEVSGKRCGRDFGLCMNPEFLRESSAVRDTFEADRIIIGEVDRRSGDVLEALYREFYGDGLPPVIRTTPVNAELIKYANNAFLAMKVSFINMIANLCQGLPGADVEVVAKAIGLDKRIGPLFLKAGAGWGGSCFPKDLKAILAYARKLDVDLPLVEAALKVNEVQPYRVVELAKKLVGRLKDRRIAVLGLAFKPGTDDMRNAVSIKIVDRLLEEGARVVVYDPKALNNARRIFGECIEYADGVESCLKDAECALIVTEWSEFRELKPEDFIRLMMVPAVVDGRRIYDPSEFVYRVRFAAIGLGAEEYANPVLAVNAVIYVDGRILLVKRDIEPFRGMWSLPGGFVEYDERVEEALTREVEDETGLKVKPKRVVGVYSDPLRSPVKHVVTICFEAEVVGGSLRVGGEVSEVKFFHVDEFPEKLAFDHRRMVEDFLKGLKAG